MKRDLPVAILIHGSGGDADVWRPVLSLFRDVAPLPVDMPGHGRSVEAAVKSIEESVAFIEGLREARGLDRIYVVGHSLGGAIAQAYALRYPERCHGIVIASSGSTFSIDPDRIALIETDFESAVDHFAEGQLSRSAPAVLRTVARAMVARRRPAAFAEDLRICRAFDSRSWIADVGVPALVVTGYDDQMTPLAGSLYH